MGNHLSGHILKRLFGIQKRIRHIRTHPLAGVPALILYYLVLRQLFGVQPYLIIGLVSALLILQHSFETIARAFLILTVIAYITGPEIEASHYMSYVYGFFVFAVIRYYIGQIAAKKKIQTHNT